MTTKREGYGKQSSDEVQEEEQRVGEVIFSGKKRNWRTLKPGFNILRFFPASKKSTKSLFLYSKIVSWLPLNIVQSVIGDKKEVFMTADNEDEVKKKIADGEYERAIKRKPVFNSVQHGATKKDLVAEYIDYATRTFAEEFQSKKDLDKKLHPLLDYKTGVKPQGSWVGYVLHKIGEVIQRGPIDISNGIRYSMKQAATREKAGAPVMVDIYSDIDEGFPVQIQYNKGAEDRNKTYETAVLIEKDALMPLSEEDLDWLEEQDTLESMFILSFKRSDFLKQVEGLKNFDKANKYNLFDNDEWGDILNEIGLYFPENEEDDGEREDVDISQSDNGDEKKINLRDLLLPFNKNHLIGFIRFHEMTYAPKKLHNEDKLMNEILKEVKEAFPDDTKAQLESLIEDYNGTLEIEEKPSKAKKEVDNTAKESDPDLQEFGETYGNEPKD